MTIVIMVLVEIMVRLIINTYIVYSDFIQIVVVMVVKHLTRPASKIYMINKPSVNLCNRKSTLTSHHLFYHKQLLMYPQT